MASRMVCSGLMTRRATIIWAPNGKRQRADQQRELHHQRALGGGVQMRGVILGGVERGFGDGDGRAEASDRDRGPLVGGHFRLLAGRDLRQQPVAQG